MLLRVPEHINLALVEPSVYTQVPNGRPSENENNLKCFFLFSGKQNPPLKMNECNFLHYDERRGL